MSERFEHGYALIIGVDENNIERLDLPIVTKDVQAVHDVLIHPQQCGYLPENVRLLKGQQATRENIFNSLRWLQDKISRDDNATVIVYYSGHGLLDKNTGYSYLIPYDIQDIKRVRTDAIRTESFAFEVHLANAKRLLTIFDAAHINITLLNKLFSLSNNEAVSSSQQDPQKGNPHMLSKGMGKAVLCSSYDTQSTYVRKDGSMSIFTYHLIEALTGHATYANSDNHVLVTDVMSWVHREVAKTAKADGIVQIPAMSTTGVFPIANLYDTQNKLLDPLEIQSPDFQSQVNDIIAEYLQKNPLVTNIYHGDHVVQQSGSGDTYNMSGDFRGAMINVKSTLSNVQQTISGMSTANDLEKQALQDSVTQLEQVLTNLPEINGEEAEAISQTTEALISMAAEEKPNKAMLKITGEGLKQAAQNLANIMPEVLTIATGIMTTVAKISGMG